MIPREAADAITASCRIERLDLGRIREGNGWTSHPLMPLIVELSRVVGEPHGGWVHWGCYHPKHHSDRRCFNSAQGSQGYSWPSRMHHDGPGRPCRAECGDGHGWSYTRSACSPHYLRPEVASWIDEIGRHITRHSPSIAFEAITRSSIPIGEALERVYLIIGGLRLNPQRMRSNLDFSGGIIGDEAIILELGKTIGRQLAHDVVYEAAQAAASQNMSFPDRLAADHRVTAYLSRSAIDGLLDPASHTGFSARIAHEQVEVARRFADEVHAHLQS
jgi:Adenylosuccinate lyase C-terminus